MTFLGFHDMNKIPYPYTLYLNFVLSASTKAIYQVCKNYDGSSYYLLSFHEMKEEKKSLVYSIMYFLHLSHYHVTL